MYGLVNWFLHRLSDTGLLGVVIYCGWYAFVGTPTSFQAAISTMSW